MAKDESTKIFTIKDGGVSVTVTAHHNADGSVTFDFDNLSGATSLNLNALYWSDGNAKTGSEKFNDTGDSSLNMNGTKVAWDGDIFLSHTGLGNGANLILTADGETAHQSITVAINFDKLQDLGIRATSVAGADTGSIKGVGLGFTNPEIQDNTPKDYFPDNGHALSTATFYFDTTVGDVKGAAGPGSNGGDGVLTVKVNFGDGAGNDLDAYYQGILDALVNKGVVAEGTAVLGVAIHAGDGKPELSEVYYKVTGDNPLDHLAQNNQIDQTYNYGDLHA